MARFVLQGALLLVVLGSTHTAHAQADTPDEVAAVTDEADAPVDLPEVAEAADDQPVGRTARVRLTYYVEAGRTYSGGQTYAGSTACSWNFPIGTRFAFPDGEVFTCNDRGLLGSAGWLDLWRRPDLASRYGPYATVKVLP